MQTTYDPTICELIIFHVIKKLRCWFDFPRPTKFLDDNRTATDIFQDSINT